MTDISRATDDVQTLDTQASAARPVRKNRANLLLNKILSDDEARSEEIAHLLVVSPQIIEQYRAGRAMPIERQMLLAAYAVERVPKFARLVHLLRGQLRATLAFEARETETHLGPPPAQHRW